MLHLQINSQHYDLDVAPTTSLAAAIRDCAGLKGTKVGCGTGDCGACSVLLGGKPVMSCQLAVGAVTGVVTTVEGLEGEASDALRAAFASEGAFQCGYCTSGQIVMCYTLLASSTNMTDPELATLLSGNLCRCTGYAAILRAVRSAAAAVCRSGARSAEDPEDE